jgi:hypothetical protein
MLLVLSFGGKLYTADGTPKRAAEARGHTLGDPPEHEGVYEIVSTPLEQGGAIESYFPKQTATPSADVYKTVVKGNGFGLGAERLIRLPSGLVVIMGAAGSGKTRLTGYMASWFACEHVVIGEPVAGSLPFDPTMLCRMIDGALKGGVTIIDSMRMATFGGSQLGPGGIPRDMGTFLSYVDYACRLSASLIIGVINVLSTEERAIESAREVVGGSVSGLIYTHGIKATGQGSGTVVGEIQMRPAMRRQMVFTATE